MIVLLLPTTYTYSYVLNLEPKQIHLGQNIASIHVFGVHVKIQGVSFPDIIIETATIVILHIVFCCLIIAVLILYYT